MSQNAGHLPEVEEEDHEFAWRPSPPAPGARERALYAAVRDERAGARGGNEPDSARRGAWVRLADHLAAIGMEASARRLLDEPPLRACAADRVWAFHRLTELDPSPERLWASAAGVLRLMDEADAAVLEEASALRDQVLAGAPEALLGLARALPIPGEGTAHEARGVDPARVRVGLLLALSRSPEAYWARRARREQALQDLADGRRELALGALEELAGEEGLDEDLRAQLALDRAQVLLRADDAEREPLARAASLLEALAAEGGPLVVHTLCRAAEARWRLDQHGQALTLWARARRAAWGSDVHALGMARDFAALAPGRDHQGTNPAVPGGRHAPRPARIVDAWSPEALSARDLWGHVPDHYRFAAILIEGLEGVALGAIDPDGQEPEVALLGGHGQLLVDSDHRRMGEIAAALGGLWAALGQARAEQSPDADAQAREWLERAVEELDVLLDRPGEADCEIRLLARDWLSRSLGPGEREALLVQLEPWPLVDWIVDWATAGHLAGIDDFSRHSIIPNPRDWIDQALGEGVGAAFVRTALCARSRILDQDGTPPAAERARLAEIAGAQAPRHPRVLAGIWVLIETDESVTAPAPPPGAMEFIAQIYAYLAAREDEAAPAVQDGWIDKQTALEQKLIQPMYAGDFRRNHAGESVTVRKGVLELSRHTGPPWARVLVRAADELGALLAEGRLDHQGAGRIVLPEPVAGDARVADVILESPPPQ